jgi:pyruvate/2-oxoglutarate dehydrogenase complex dihydrolipoamide acyltransferase (E2) component
MSVPQGYFLRGTLKAVYSRPSALVNAGCIHSIVQGGAAAEEARAFSVSVREAAANTISSTLWLTSEEAAAEEATDDAALEAAPPQAVRAAAAPAIPAAVRKLRREMRWSFISVSPYFK